MIEYNQASAAAWSRLGSRKCIGAVMGEFAREHKELMVLTADFGKSAGLSEFAQQYPDQYLDVGIAEQNMIGVAAGLALEGRRVFVFSFSPFASMRCFEAVRSYLGYMNLNVTVVGMASGISLGCQGNTHFGLEDVALMRTVPNLTVLEPCDCMEMVKALEALLQHDGPAYLRLTGIPGAMSIYNSDYDFRIGKGTILRQGQKTALIGAGAVLAEALRASRALVKKGVDLTVVDMSAVKPLDEELIRQILGTHDTVYVLEEHSETGGLYAAVAEVYAYGGFECRLKKIAIPNGFCKVAKYQKLLELYGMTGPMLLKRILTDREQESAGV